MRKCVICDQEEPAYPVLDAASGFYFCDGCWMKAGDAFDKYKERTFSNWLRVIADLRDKYSKEKVIKPRRAKVSSRISEEYIT